MTVKPQPPLISIQTIKKQNPTIIINSSPVSHNNNLDNINTNTNTNNHTSKNIPFESLVKINPSGFLEMNKEIYIDIEVLDFSENSNNHKNGDNNFYCNEIGDNEYWEFRDLLRISPKGELVIDNSNHVEIRVDEVIFTDSTTSTNSNYNYSNNHNNNVDNYFTQQDEVINKMKENGAWESFLKIHPDNSLSYNKNNNNVQIVLTDYDKTEFNIRNHDQNANVIVNDVKNEIVHRIVDKMINQNDWSKFIKIDKDNSIIYNECEIIITPPTNNNKLNQNIDIGQYDLESEVINLLQKQEDWEQFLTILPDNTLLYNPINYNNNIITKKRVARHGSGVDIVVSDFTKTRTINIDHDNDENVITITNPNEDGNDHNSNVIDIDDVAYELFRITRDGSLTLENDQILKNYMNESDSEFSDYDNEYTKTFNQAIIKASAKRKITTFSNCKITNNGDMVPFTLITL
eukprot:Pgem_evm1s2322